MFCNKFVIHLFGLAFTLALINSDAWCQDKFTITSSGFDNEFKRIETPQMWKFHSGDSLVWAETSFDDSNWDYLNCSLIEDNRITPKWNEIGWFRIQLEVDSSFWNKRVAVSLRQLGAAEVYLNGKRIMVLGKFARPGKIGRTFQKTGQQARVITLPPQRDQLLAVRFGSLEPGHNLEYYNMSGFRLNFYEPESFQKRVSSHIVEKASLRMFYTGLSIGFALLHFLMFLFYPRVKSNLYFAIFGLSLAGITFFPVGFSYMGDVKLIGLYFNLFKIAIISSVVFGILALYKIFYKELPKQFKFIVILGSMLAVASLFVSITPVYIFAFIGLLEVFRVVALAIIRRKEFAWIIGVGYIFFIAGAGFQMSLRFRGIMPDDAPPLYLYGIFAFLLSMSIYLARNFARMNQDLMNRLLQVEELSKKTLEQERAAQEKELSQKLLEQKLEYSAKELEEARKLEKALVKLESTNRELRDTQIQLVQSEKMASLGQLVAGIAHEINTPVGAINSMHDSLTRGLTKLKETALGQCDSEETRSRFISLFEVVDDANQVINSGAERVGTIVKRLRSFARLDEAELKKVDIHDGLEDTLTLVHHELKHDIEVVKNFSTLDPIPCFPGQLNQVFLNLIVNARQAIKGKGKITISTRQEGKKVFIEISDTGVGIPKESLGRIFDPGFTTKGVGVGTGLGLSICYQIIETHRGKITVESEAGKGTTFTIILPKDLDKRIENEKELDYL